MFYQHQTSSRNSDGVIPCGSTKYRWGIKISRFVSKTRYISQMIQDSAIVTMEGEVLCDLSPGSRTVAVVGTSDNNDPVTLNEP